MAILGQREGVCGSGYKICRGAISLLRRGKDNVALQICGDGMNLGHSAQRFTVAAKRQVQYGARSYRQSRRWSRICLLPSIKRRVSLTQSQRSSTVSPSSNRIGGSTSGTLNPACKPSCARDSCELLPNRGPHGPGGFVKRACRQSVNPPLWG